MQFYTILALVVILPTLVSVFSLLIALRKLRFTQRAYELLSYEQLSSIDQKVLKLGINNLMQLGFKEWAFEKSTIHGYCPHYTHVRAIMHATVDDVHVYAFIAQALQPNQNECPLTIDLMSFENNENFIVTSQTADNIMLSPLLNCNYSLSRVESQQLLKNHITQVKEKNWNSTKLFFNAEEIEECLSRYSSKWLAYHIENQNLIEVKPLTYVYSTKGLIQPLRRGFKLRKAYLSVKGNLIEDEEKLISHPETIEKLITFNQIVDESPSYFSKIENILLFLLSFIAAAASFKLLNYDFQTLFIILAVIFIHELGHALGMLLFGYKNVKFFFLPFFGGFAIGKKPENNPSGEILMLLLGPVPGIMISCVIFLMQDKFNIPENSFLLDFARVSLYINIFNLLPIDPLDGGKICNLILFCRFPKLQTLFMFFSGVILILTLSPILALIGGSIIYNIKKHWRMNHTAKKLRKVKDATVSNTCLAISQSLPAVYAKKSTSMQRLLIFKNIINQSKLKPVGLIQSFVFMSIYISSMCIVPGITVLNAKALKQIEYEDMAKYKNTIPSIDVSSMTETENEISVIGDLPLKE